MKRGHVVILSGRGDYSRKPRPALVVQNDLFNGKSESVVTCPITTTLTGSGLVRIAVGPGGPSGLKHRSEIQIDKVEAVHASRIREVVGLLGASEMRSVDQALRRWLDL